MMQSLQIIAAVDRRWGLGQDGNLLFRIREDLQRFKTLTLGNVVIMGRKTLESLPQGRPLPGRDTIVLTRNEKLSVPGAAICHSLTELAQLLHTGPYAGRMVYVAGGAELYNLLLPYCAYADITHVFAARAADCALPRLSRREGWVRESVTGAYTSNELRYVFATYKNLHPRPLADLGAVQLNGKPV